MYYTVVGPPDEELAKVWKSKECSLEWSDLLNLLEFETCKLLNYYTVLVQIKAFI